MGIGNGFLGIRNSLQLQPEKCNCKGVASVDIFFSSKMPGAPLNSRMSLKSVKSVAQEMPKKRVFPWVAQWFTIPQLVIKCLEMVLTLTMVTLMLTWRSEGTEISDLNQGSFNFRNRMYCYIGLGLLSMFYAMSLTALGLAGYKLAPSVQTFLAGTFLGMWVLGAPVMSATMNELDNTLFARRAGLDIFYLQIATVLGFFSMGTFVLDILLGFLALRSMDDSKQFATEVQNSKSMLLAVKSGKSLADVKREATPRQLSFHRPGSRSSQEQPVTELSPLKSHEEIEDETVYNV